MKTILISCTGNSVTGTAIVKMQQQLSELFLKISQNSQENTYVESLF